MRKLKAGLINLSPRHHPAVELSAYMGNLEELWFLFRQKSDEQRRYLEVTPRRRLAMAGMYFGLIAFLLLGMALTQIVPASEL